MRTRSTPQQLLAVSFALIMLVSMGGLAFVGGAGAQTGGTYNQVITSQQDVSTQLNTDETVQLAGSDVEVAPDGRILIGSSDNEEFQGITLSSDRIAATTGVDKPSDDRLATFLKEDVPAEFNVSTNESAGTAIPAVFIEFDPQSEFSQISNISNTGNVSGTHDYIVVAPANASTGTLDADDQLNGTVDTNLNATDNDHIAEGDIVALSVENDGSADANSTLLASGENFGTVFDNLVGTSEADLQDKNIDQVQFAAGTFDDTAVAIEEVQLADNIDSDFQPGQTIHSEKVTLNDGSERFFSSISEAVNTSDGGNTITVDNGTYSVLEGQNVTVDTADTIETTSRVNTGPTIDRVDETDTSIADPGSEAIINTSLEVTASATIENVVVENGSQAAVNITDSGATLENVIVNQTATNTGVNASASGATISGSTVLANDATLFEDGEVGLELNENDGANVTNNYFVGFETQVANVSAAANTSTLFDANNFADDRVQSAVPVDGNGDVQSDSVFGSINASDSEVSDSGIISVSAGTYDEGTTLVVANNSISVDGAGTGATVIENDVEFNSSDRATLIGVSVNGSVTAVDDGNTPDVKIDTVELTASNISINAAEDVTIQDVNIPDAGVDAIDINASLSRSLSVENVTVGNLTGGTALNATEVGTDVTVTELDVTGNTSGADGINLGNVGDGDGNGVVSISNNNLTDLGNGTALRLNESSGSAAEVDIDGNTFRADNGSEFTGIEYNLDDTTGSNITDNTIIGADVTGGAASIGINLVNVTVSAAEVGEGVTDPESDVTVEALTVTGNHISGHARVINSEDEEVISSDYDNIVDNNEFGTLVYAPAGETYESTYGLTNSSEVDELGLARPTVSYLPGGVVSAVDLVNSSATTGFADFRDQQDSEYTPEIQVYSTADDDGPTNYTEPSEVVMPDIRGLTITGEDQPVVETRFVINSSDAINNHTIQDLGVSNGDSEPAINVTDGHNSQSTFENLDVTSDGSGVVVNATETDVNVIEIRNSEFDVAADGIVLAAQADDRDGFVIENTTVTGPGIAEAGSVGLNLTQVDKPGKAGLGTNLTVTNNYIADFEKQVAMTTADTNVTALNFTSEQFSNEFDTDAEDGITINENEFGQQVLVFEGDSDPQDVSDENVTLNDTELYGSIQAAHDNASADNVTIRVYDVTSEVNYDTPSGEQTTYNEDLNITENNVTVRGPTFDTGPADSAYRPDEVLISGTVELNGLGVGDNSSAAVTGFTVVADDTPDEVVNVTNGVGNLTIANTAVSARNATTDGLEEEVNGVNISNTSAAGALTLDGLFVGNHDEAQTVNSSVVVNNGTLTLDIIDSTLTSETDTEDGIGLEYLAGGQSNTTVTNTTISDHAEEGIDLNGKDVNVTVTGGSTIEANGADGFNATASDSNTIIVNDGTTVDNNGGTGIFADGNVTVTVDSATISNDTNGVEIENVTADSRVVSSTINANGVGLAVNASEVTPEVTGNTFTNEETDISTTDSDGATLDASLNYFGSANGPEAASAAGVDDTVVYDPFLSENKTESSVSEVETTTEFAHDIVLPADTIRTVGIPAGLAEDADTVGDVFDPDLNGTVYGWNASADQFETAAASDEVEAFDAFVIENSEDSPSVATIEYQSSFTRNDFVPDTFEFEAGPNFVPAQEVGTVDEALFTGGDTDVVVLPFASGENLYGDTRSDQVRDEFTTRSADGFAGNFRSGVGDEVVHPHVGYFVIVNEESNVGQEVTERITTADTVTDASNVASQTGATAATYQVSDLSVTANASNNSANVVVDIVNTGDVDGDTQTVTVTGLAGLGNSEDKEDVTLDAGSSETVEVTLSNGGLSPGDQVRVEVTTDDDSDRATATATATATQPAG